MKKFKELFPDKVKLRIRFSLDNLKLDDDVLNIPLFMADQADRLIGLAWEHGNLKTDTNTYYNITLFLSANIERNYWFRGRYQMI